MNLSLIIYQSRQGSIFYLLYTIAVITAINTTQMSYAEPPLSFLISYLKILIKPSQDVKSIFIPRNCKNCWNSHNYYLLITGVTCYCSLFRSSSSFILIYKNFSHHFLLLLKQQQQLLLLPPLLSPPEWYHLGLILWSRPYQGRSWPWLCRWHSRLCMPPEYRYSQSWISGVCWKGFLQRRGLCSPSWHSVARSSTCGRAFGRRPLILRGNIFEPRLPRATQIAEETSLSAGRMVAVEELLRPNNMFNTIYQSGKSMEARAWLDAIPKSEAQTMLPSEFVPNPFRNRLLISYPQLLVHTTYTCGKVVDPYGIHM